MLRALAAAAAPVMAMGQLLLLATSPGAGAGKQVPVQVLSSIALILRKGTECSTHSPPLQCRHRNRVEIVAQLPL